MHDDFTTRKTDDSLPTLAEPTACEVVRASEGVLADLWTGDMDLTELFSTDISTGEVCWQHASLVSVPHHSCFVVDLVTDVMSASNCMTPPLLPSVVEVDLPEYDWSELSGDHPSPRSSPGKPLCYVTWSIVYTHPLTACLCAAALPSCLCYNYRCELCP